MQKLLQCCRSDQRFEIFKSIQESFIEISCHPIGVHSMQTMVELINTKEEEEAIVQTLDNKHNILILSYVLFINFFYFRIQTVTRFYKEFLLQSMKTKESLLMI